MFARGKRPDRSALKAFVAGQSAISISHDPLAEHPVELVSSDEGLAPKTIANETGGCPTNWMELLCEGLAFDLKGLSPGEGAAVPPVRHRFDIDAGLDLGDHEALVLVPGHHLAGGERAMPVVKGLLGLARDLVHNFEDLEAIIWPASASAIGPRFFESVITAWLDGGPFPALGLTAFEEIESGALQSVGLDFWIDQELLIEPPLSVDKIAATRLGVRLVNQLVLVGGIDGSERVVAPDGGRLVMRMSRNERFIRVSRE